MAMRTGALSFERPPGLMAPPVPSPDSVEAVASAMARGRQRARGRLVPVEQSVAVRAPPTRCEARSGSRVVLAVLAARAARAMPRG